jgi:hypothetical protein
VGGQFLGALALESGAAVGEQAGGVGRWHGRTGHASVVGRAA